MFPTWWLTERSVCVTSIIRIYYTYKPNDPPSKLTLSSFASYSAWLTGDVFVAAILQAAIWNTLQLAFAIICACLPTYRSILPKSTFFISGFQRLYSSAPVRKLKDSLRSSHASHGEDTVADHEGRNGSGEKILDEKKQEQGVSGHSAESRLWQTRYPLDTVTSGSNTSTLASRDLEAQSPALEAQGPLGAHVGRGDVVPVKRADSRFTV